MVPQSPAAESTCDEESPQDDCQQQQPPKREIQTITLGDSCPHESNKPLTIFAKHHVRADKLDVFERWCREMQAKSRLFEGYIDTEIIRPTCLESSDEYIAIFRFDSYTHLQVWMNSDERQSMIDRIPEFSNSKTLVYSYHSLEHWFSNNDDSNNSSATAEDNNSTVKGRGGGPPAKYKMWVVTTGVIYSQTLWVPQLMAQILTRTNTDINPNLLGFLNTAIIVTLSTFLFFPIVTRLLAFWLFPGCNYKEKLLELVPSSLLQNKFLSSAENKKKKKKDTDDSARTVSIVTERSDLPI